MRTSTTSSSTSFAPFLCAGKLRCRRLNLQLMIPPWEGVYFFGSRRRRFRGKKVLTERREDEIYYGNALFGLMYDFGVLSNAIGRPEILLSYQVVET